MHIGRIAKITKLLRILYQLIKLFLKICNDPTASNIHFCLHSGLEYRSQPLADCDENQPFCLFCDQDRINRFLCEREIVAETRQKMECMDRMQYFSSLSEEEFRNQQSFLQLTNGYCK